MKKIKLILTIFILAPLVPVLAQEYPSILTDRPNQTESPYSVPKGLFQIESGALMEDAGDKMKTYLLPTVLWRYGITDRIELRLNTELLRYTIREDDEMSVNPIDVGFKAMLIDENGLIPQIAFLAHLSFSHLSADELQTEYVSPNFRFLFQHDLSDRVSIGYNLGAEWDGDNAEPIYIYSLTGAFSLTEKLGAFLEGYGFAPEKSKGDLRADVGFTYLLRPNMQFDVSGGIGITDNAPDHFLSAGFSIRLPK